MSGSALPAASPSTSRSPSLICVPPSSRSAVAKRPGRTASGGVFHMTSSTTSETDRWPLTSPASREPSVRTISRTRASRLLVVVWAVISTRRRWLRISPSSRPAACASSPVVKSGPGSARLRSASPPRISMMRSLCSRASGPPLMTWAQETARLRPPAAGSPNSRVSTSIGRYSAYSPTRSALPFPANASICLFAKCVTWRRMPRPASVSRLSVTALRSLRCGSPSWDTQSGRQPSIWISGDVSSTPPSFQSRQMRESRLNWRGLSSTRRLSR